MTGKTLIANVLAILIAAVAADGIVRVAIHPALDYTSGFSPGPYCLNPALGISFKCPDRTGIMHVIGTKIYLPHRMNEDGFRGPFRSSSHDGNVSHIVALGGQSQAFGFGLRDQDTIGATIARSCGAAEVHVFALPGVTDAQSWMLYNLSAQAKSSPDQIVLLVQSRSKKDWRHQMSPGSKLFDGLTYALLYGWPYEIPQWLEKVSDSFLIIRSVNSIREIGAYFGFIKKAPPEFGPDLYTADFVTAMFQEARRLNAKFSVAFMPGARERGLYVDVGAIERALPDVRFIDVDAKSVALHLYPEQLLPDRHYNAQLAKFIGTEIARSICPADQDAPANASGAAH